MTFNHVVQSASTVNTDFQSLFGPGHRYLEWNRCTQPTPFLNVGMRSLDVHCAFSPVKNSNCKVPVRQLSSKNIGVLGERTTLHCTLEKDNILYLHAFKQGSVHLQSCLFALEGRTKQGATRAHLFRLSDLLPRLRRHRLAKS